MGVKLDLAPLGKDIHLGYFRTGCWGERLELRWRKSQEA